MMQYALFTLLLLSICTNINATNNCQRVLHYFKPQCSLPPQESECMGRVFRDRCDVEQIHLVYNNNSVIEYQPSSCVKESFEEPLISYEDLCTSKQVQVLASDLSPVCHFIKITGVEQSMGFVSQVMAFSNPTISSVHFNLNLLEIKLNDAGCCPNNDYTVYYLYDNLEPEFFSTTNASSTITAPFSFCKPLKYVQIQCKFDDISVKSDPYPVHLPEIFSQAVMIDKDVANQVTVQWYPFLDNFPIKLNSNLLTLLDGKSSSSNLNLLQESNILQFECREEQFDISFSIPPNNVEYIWTGSELLLNSSNYKCLTNVYCRYQYSNHSVRVIVTELFAVPKISRNIQSDSLNVDSTNFTGLVELQGRNITGKLITILEAELEKVVINKKPVVTSRIVVHVYYGGHYIAAVFVLLFVSVVASKKLNNSEKVVNLTCLNQLPQKDEQTLHTIVRKLGYTILGGNNTTSQQIENQLLIYNNNSSSTVELAIEQAKRSVQFNAISNSKLLIYNAAEEDHTVYSYNISNSEVIYYSVGEDMQASAQIIQRLLDIKV